jgi:hypothetical protein|tara:strand:+ start:21421 stop:22287 length:867 start_codon:yes stop_codon:yes gene_type:complete
MSEEATGSVLSPGSSEATESAPAETASADWKASLPEDIRSDPSLKDITDIPNLAKSLINAQGMIGKDRIALPSEDATDTEMKDFYGKIGRPDEAKAYDLGERPTLPEGLEYDEEFESTFRDVAHKAGLTQKQTKDIYDGYNSYVSKKAELEGENGTVQMNNWVEQMKKDFGKAYDERIDLAQRAIEKFGSGDVKDWMNSTGMGNNPMFVKMFANIGEIVAEGKGDVPATRQFTMTPQQAQQEISRYNRDTDFMTAYASGDHQGHTAAVQKMNDLFKLAYPDETPVAPA